MELEFINSPTHFVIGEEIPQVKHKYKCNILNICNNEIISEPYIIDNISMVMELKKAFYYVISSSEVYIVLLPKSPKCSTFKVIKCREKPVKNYKITGFLLTDIKTYDGDVITKWEPHISDTIVGINIIGSIPIAITNSSLYYCINCVAIETKIEIE